MNYQKIVDGFITEYPDYKSDVINFTEYLETHWEILCRANHSVFYLRV